MADRVSSEDVIRILYEVETRFKERHEKCCKDILEAILASDALMEANFIATQAMIQSSQAAILAAIQALVPPEEATSANLEYSLASAKKRFR